MGQSFNKQERGCCATRAPPGLVHLSCCRTLWQAVRQLLYHYCDLSYPARPCLTDWRKHGPERAGGVCVCVCLRVYCMFLCVYVCACVCSNIAFVCVGLYAVWASVFMCVDVCVFVHVCVRGEREILTDVHRQAEVPCHGPLWFLLLTTQACHCLPDSMRKIPHNPYITGALTTLTPFCNIKHSFMSPRTPSSPVAPLPPDTQAFYEHSHCYMVTYP